MSSSTATLAQAVHESSGRATTPSNAIVFAFTSFLSAFLLFQVQLIVSKYILPWFGGSAAVWTTSMLVFQLLLLAGYTYSHIVSVRLLPAAQTRLHVALLAAALLLIILQSFVWPSAITPGAAWKPLPSGRPIRDVATIILIAVGLPFFVLSTTAPLLQRWFARLGGGVRTYKLYSVSNIGSLLGLVTFPFLFEPTFRVKLQGRLWSLLFGVFVASCGLCVWRTFKATNHALEDTELRAAPSQADPSLLAYVLWFALAACPSSVLLATTNRLCQEVTTVPLLWVLPFSLYLLSFILTFDHPRWYNRGIYHPLFAVSLFLTGAVLIFEHSRAELGALLGLLFFTCMICHGELARLKPDVKHLTSYYLAISAGGAAGGIFVGVIAPHVFTSFVEFQLSLGLAVILALVTLILDPQSWIFRRDFWQPVAIAIGAILIAYAAGRLLPEVAKLLQDVRFYPLALIIGAIVSIGALAIDSSGSGVQRGFRFVQLPVAALVFIAFAVLYKSAQPQRNLYWSARNFYGVLRVSRHIGSKTLTHGQIIHGEQLDPPNEHLPVAYYGASSGIGILLQDHPKRHVGPGSLRVGVVGLGVGTLAAYGRPGDYMRYYEIDPDVVRLSSGPQPVFTYIRDSPAEVSIVQGDARLSLAREAAQGEFQKFDILVLDAFSGDAIPVHLLTKEAFETYWHHMNPEVGVIAVHITSRHVNLSPVLRGVSAHFKTDYLLTLNPRQGPVFESRWVLLARRPGLLQIPELEQITVLPREKIAPQLWTDDYSDVFRLIH